MEDIGYKNILVIYKTNGNNANNNISRYFRSFTSDELIPNAVWKAHLQGNCESIMSSISKMAHIGDCITIVELDQPHRQLAKSFTENDFKSNWTDPFTCLQDDSQSSKEQDYPEDPSLIAGFFRSF